MRYQLTFLLFAFLCFIQPSNAVVAYPYPIKLTQPDGSTLVVTLHGDECHHYMTTDIKSKNVVVCKGKDGFYHPDTLPIKESVRLRNAYIQQSASPSSFSIGAHHFLVMLIEFDDVRFTLPQPDSAFFRMLNQENYTENGATGSVRDYFNDQSMGKFTPIYDVVGPITVPCKMDSFTVSNGMTQSGAPELLARACKMADTIVDFSKYDIDNDGYIDNISFYYAGYNAAEGVENTIWPHSWTVSKAHYFDGKRLFRYACTSEYRGVSGNEMAGIGTFCHEFGHVIGLPDFYDTNEETGGRCRGLWTYSLMCYGNYNNDGKTPPSFNCEERYLLGWMDSIPWLPAKDTLMSLEPINDGIGYRSPTDNDGEYHYYEFRSGTKWDAPLKPGLLVYHVDKSNNMVSGMTAANRWNSGTGINSYSAHECFKLEQADKEGKIYPFGNGKTQFDAYTSPSSLAWDSVPSKYGLYDISYDAERATFQLLYDHVVSLENPRNDEAVCICHDGIVELHVSPESTDSSDSEMEIYTMDGHLIARIPVEDGTAIWHCEHHTGIVLARYSANIFKLLLR